MKNSAVDKIQSDVDFSDFISRFTEEISDNNPDYTDSPSVPLEMQKSNPKIKERQIIRANIYNKHRIDIYKLPLIVFYQNDKIKGFKTQKEAVDFSESLRLKGIHSLLVNIMNYEITSHLFN